MKRPNILLIIPHDLGDHLGCCGHATVRSPAIDRLASDGVRFTNCFTTSPECTPSRGGLYSGLYPHQNGLMGLSNFGWQLRVPHMASHLASAGYETHLFGLQHETDGDPCDLGYTHLHSSGNRRVGGVCESVESFLRSEESHGNKPWFVCAGFFDVHRSWGGYDAPCSFGLDDVEVPPYLPDTPEIRRDLCLFHHNIEEMDSAVGKVLDTLRESGQASDTLVIFTTDHGCGFPRAKATLYDPGLRVPMILYWQGHIEGGTAHDCLLSNMDLLPSLLDLAEAENQHDMEGRSFLPLLSGRTYEERDVVCGELFYDVAYDPMHYVRTRTHKYIRSFAVTPEDAEGADQDVLCSFVAGQWIRVDDYDVMHNPSWESIKGDFPRPPREELYDLVSDPLEQVNLADDQEATRVLEDMRVRLDDMMKRTESPLLTGHVAPPPEQKAASEKYRPGGPMYAMPRT